MSATLRKSKLGTYFRLFKCRFNHKYDASTSTGEKCAPSLTGIRVLDMTRVLAGPYASMLLGDLGAEVIKVERPGVGDETRTWVPPKIGSESCYFMSINRNKKSIAINTKVKEGSKVVQELARHSDVFLENFLPGKLAEAGLGYEQLREINPGLVYCSITGYGQTGPYKERGGYDTIAAGMAGLMHITGPTDGAPCRVGIAMTDMSTGLYAVVSVLAALRHRDHTSQGQHIDCNLLSTQVATMTHLASNFLNTGHVATRHGTGHGSIVPYQAFRTSDGYINIGVGSDARYRDLCHIVELPGLASDPDYETNEVRVKNRDKLVKMLGDRFLEKTTAEWMETFKGTRVTYGPINDMAQVFNDPQVLHNNLIQEMEHPTVGKVKVAGPAVSYSGMDMALQHPPPTLGQHTDEVLSTVLGYNQEHIDKLRDLQAVA